MAQDNQYIPPELEERVAAGKAGQLWTIEVVYTLDSVVDRFKKRNLYSHELLKVRESIFRYGLTIPTSERGHWRCVVPIDLQTVDLWKQSGYFPE